MAGFKWQKVDLICQNEKEIGNREIDLKNISMDNQLIMIELMNKFNRAFCKEHKQRRLSTSHLLDDHGIVMDYE